MTETPLEEALIRNEGLRLKPYRCTEGKLTIGVGRNLEDVGITRAEALYLLRNDIQRVSKRMGQNAVFNTLGLVRQQVLVRMCFNLGTTRLKKFKRMWAALADRDFSLAASEMLESKWARQVKGRAKELAGMMKRGQL